MSFKLTLESKNIHPIIPITYQYPISAAIYKVLERADADYTAFLHENLWKGPPKSHLVVIKADTTAQTRIRGFLNFGPQLEAKPNQLEGIGHLEVDIT